MKIRKGDTVLVVAGKDKGKEGTVEVTGINTAVRHQRALRANEQGGRIDKDMPIDISNVMLVHKGKPVRVGYRTESDGSKVRIARPSGEVIK
jgi:large subunit ribosomal protein L24